MYILMIMIGPLDTESLRFAITCSIYSISSLFSLYKLAGKSDRVWITLRETLGLRDKLLNRRPSWQTNEEAILEESLSLRAEWVVGLGTGRLETSRG